MMAMMAEIPFCILSKYLCYNKSIQVDKENYEHATNLIIHDHHLIKGSSVITLDKLTSTVIYTTLISKIRNKPSSNTYFENLFNGCNIDWTAIYMLPRLATCNTYMRSFQYKILNNVLFLRKKLDTWKKVISTMFFL